MVTSLPGWQTSLAAAISALALALAAGNWVFLIARAARTRQYRARKDSKGRRKDGTQDFVRRAIPLPASHNDPYRKLGGKLAEWIAPLHGRANAAQNKYYKALTYSISSIVTGFVVLALNQAIFTNWVWFDLFTNWLDLFAVCMTLYAFVLANRYNREWVVSRIRAELMRQYSALIALKYRDFDGAQRKWRQEVLRLDEVLAGSTNDDSLEAIVKMSSRQFQDEFARQDKDGSHIDPAFVRAYLHMRVLTQLRWFGSSAESAFIADAARDRFLRNLFFLCFLVSSAKLSTMHYQSSGILLSTLSFSSVIIFGLSIILTIEHIGQNRRSLSHQYRAQFRRIETWLEEFVARHANYLQGKASGENIEDDLLFFERMVTEELYAWIYITRGGRLTLAP
jgi:hypothetical protein